MTRSSPPPPADPVWSFSWAKADNDQWGERYHGVQSATARPDKVCPHLHTHPALAINCARTDFGRNPIPRPARNVRAVRRTPSGGQLDLLEQLHQQDEDPPF